MWLVETVVSLVLILLILIDAFETTVLPRRVQRRFRFARFYYRTSWNVWRALALRFLSVRLREAFLSYFGPLSLLGLLFSWVVLLIVSFALLHWSLSSVVQAPDAAATFTTYLYFSGTTFFTLGYGDVVPLANLGRVLAVAESGLGFGFLAVIIGYVPVIYQAFSRREILISLLDARAGSPPSASQLLVRLARSGDLAAVDPFLADWERWAAEVLESHLSFAVLSFYRSQHDNQSWLAALTTVLDACSVLLVAETAKRSYQARVTFAMARHAIVDLAMVYQVPPQASGADRLSVDDRQHLWQRLREAGLDMREREDLDAKLAELRGMYEPFVEALGRFFLFSLPAFVSGPTVDNWQRSAWMKRAPEIDNLPIGGVGDVDLD
jgi:hypothetical protein